MSKSESKFKTGEVVSLKSGGPKMTIIEVISQQKPYEKDVWINMCNVMWFDNTELKRNTFNEDLLESA